MGSAYKNELFNTWINENKPKSVNILSIIQEINDYLQTLENPPPIELIIHILFSTNFHHIP